MSASGTANASAAFAVATAASATVAATATATKPEAKLLARASPLKVPRRAAERNVIHRFFFYFFNQRAST